MYTVELHEWDNSYVVTDSGYIVARDFKTKEDAQAWIDEKTGEQDKEAKIITPEKAKQRLLKLVDESPTFEHFKQRLQSFTRFYLGDPMPEPFRMWGWAQFQDFYNQNKR